MQTIRRRKRNIPDLLMRIGVLLGAALLLNLLLPLPLAIAGVGGLWAFYSYRNRVVEMRNQERRVEGDQDGPPLRHKVRKTRYLAVILLVGAGLVLVVAHLFGHNVMAMSFSDLCNFPRPSDVCSQWENEALAEGLAVLLIGAAAVFWVRAKGSR
jgi:hypothetical protein